MLELLLGYFIKVENSAITLNKVIELESGNTIIIGNYLNENSINEIVLLKVSKYGNLIFSKSIYSQNYISFVDGVYNNGKIYILGISNYQSYGNNILFIVVDTNSNIITSKIYPIENYENPSSIAIENNKIYIVGTANPTGTIRPFFLILDSIGIPKFIKIAYVFSYNATNLRGLFLEGDYIYTFGDYYDYKRIGFIFKFDTNFNLIQGKRIYINNKNFPIYSFIKNNNNLFLLSDKYLVVFRNDWKILHIKNFSNISPKFLNYSNSLEIFGISDNKPFYYVYDNYFPILRKANFYTSNLRYAKNYIIADNYVFYKNEVCDVFEDNLFYLSDTIIDLNLQNFLISLHTFSVPYINANLNVRDINVQITNLCSSNIRETFNYFKQMNNKILFLEEGYLRIFKIDGSLYKKLKTKNNFEISLERGIYIFEFEKANKIYKNKVVVY